MQSTLSRAVIFSAMTTATAFGSLWLSSHPGTSSMGQLMALALLCTMAAAVLFQPALMGPPREVARAEPRAPRRPNPDDEPRGRGRGGGRVESARRSRLPANARRGSVRGKNNAAKRPSDMPAGPHRTSSAEMAELRRERVASPPRQPGDRQSARRRHPAGARVPFGAGLPDFSAAQPVRVRPAAVAVAHLSRSSTASAGSASTCSAPGSTSS